jgi:hypothetical protein
VRAAEKERQRIHQSTRGDRETKLRNVRCVLRRPETHEYVTSALLQDALAIEGLNDMCQLLSCCSNISSISDRGGRAVFRHELSSAAQIMVSGVRIPLEAWTLVRNSSGFVFSCVGNDTRL